MQHVIAVRGDHQIINRQTHTMRQISRIDVTEITGRHRKVNGSLWSTDGKRSIKIVHNLRHDARPIDRVNGDQRASIGQELIGHKTGFYQRLAVIKIAFNG